MLKGPWRGTNMTWGIAEAPLQQGIGKDSFEISYIGLVIYAQKDKIELEEEQKQPIALSKEEQ